MSGEGADEVNELPDVGDKLPKDLTPLNIKAWLSQAGFTCGCSETDLVVKRLVDFLEFHALEDGKDYEKVCRDVGDFYIIAMRLDSLGLAEHGTSIRYPWLTDEGKRLLAALKKHGWKAIDDSFGIAYDGLTHPDGNGNLRLDEVVPPQEDVKCISCGGDDVQVVTEVGKPIVSTRMCKGCGYSWEVEL